MDTDRTLQLVAGRRIGRIAVLVACGLFAALALPAAASAARGLTTGFHDDEYQSSDMALRATWLDRVVDAKARIVRFTVPWDAVAGNQRPPDPTNPGSASYDFSLVDAGARDAAARGLTVLLNTSLKTPVWAEGPGRPASAAPGTWKPNPADFADFHQALAARYSGTFDPDGAGPAPPLPAAQALEVWNEPNLEYWLSPQFEGKTAVGVEHYRLMLNAAYNAIKAVNPRMLVLPGGTAPYGDPPGGPYPPDGARQRPVQFWQQLLCVRPAKGKKGKKAGDASKEKLVRAKGCAGKALFDVLAHHSISNTGKGPQESGPNRYDASTPDLARIVNVLRAAERLGTLSGGRHPVWVTEFWWDSNPPNPTGAPLAVQARWIEESMYLFWKAGASAAINFQIRDALERPDARAGYQAGVFFNDGQAKPSLTAFRFPFVAERINEQLLNVWGKAPAGGQLVIQRQQGGSFVTIRKLQVREGGVFLAKLKLPGKQRLRAEVAGTQSLVYKTKSGPLTADRP